MAFRMEITIIWYIWLIKNNIYSNKDLNPYIIYKNDYKKKQK